MSLSYPDIAGGTCITVRKSSLEKSKWKSMDAFVLIGCMLTCRVTNYLALQPATWAHTNTSASCTEKNSPMCCVFYSVSGES